MYVYSNQVVIICQVSQNNALLLIPLIHWATDEHTCTLYHHVHDQVKLSPVGEIVRKPAHISYCKTSIIFADTGYIYQVKWSILMTLPVIYSTYTNQSLTKIALGPSIPIVCTSLTKNIHIRPFTSDVEKNKH